MRITVDFDNWDEMEAFRVSGKSTRRKKGEEDPVTVEEVTAAVAANTPAPAPAAGFPAFTPPATAAPTVHPLVAAIVAKVDGAIQSGQPADAITNWFRQTIGPDAAQATLDQIKQVFIPRLAEPQLKQLAQQVGITVT